MQQLTYRGARYSLRNPAVEAVETDYEGQFLGARYRMTTSKGNVTKRTPQQLSYRCIKYTGNSRKLGSPASSEQGGKASERF